MYLTDRIQVRKSKELSLLCHQTKNLYNLGNWYVRQDFFHLGNVLTYCDLDFICQKTEAYRALPTQTAQQVLRLVVQNWKAYFRAAADYRKNPGKYLGRPHLPGYKTRAGECVATFTSQQCRIRGRYLLFPKRVALSSVKLRENLECIHQVRVLPRGDRYILEVVYEKAVHNLGLDNKRAIGVDIGVCNLATVVGNAGQRPFVIKGGMAKSVNHYFNRALARLRSVAQKTCGRRTTRRIWRLCWRRETKIRDIFHKVSRYIINYCIGNNVGTIVAGYNPGWKQGCQLGRCANQSFVQLPFHTLVAQLQYKAALVGITVILVDERYTSRCSAMDGEPVGRHVQYAGRRVSRGLFQTHAGVLINADVNGAYNILRQAVPEALADGIQGAGRHPGVITIS